MKEMTEPVYRNDFDTFEYDISQEAISKYVLQLCKILTEIDYEIHA